MNEPTPLSRSLLQFSVVLAVIGVLASGLLDALHYTQEQTEKLVVESTLRNISSGLLAAVAEKMFQGKDAEIRQLADTNPVNWLEKPPAGYLGEFSSVPQEFPRGAWGFDATRKELLYRPILDRNLKLAAVDGILRWKIEGGAASGKPAGQADWIKMKTLTAYQWF